MKGISVIICCYNSGEKLIPTLSYLAKQKSIPGVPFEIIIVDNNCTDNSSQIAINTWSDLNKPLSLLVVKESIPGLNYARKKGIQNAKYDYVILCDDDNWLCDDYLVKVFSLFEAMPEVALIGGVGEAVSETALPNWFKSVNGFGYAVGTEGRVTGYVDSVYGAGMAFRRDVFNLITKDLHFILTDRKGKSLSSGGDTEISMLVKNAGYKTYLDEGLTFKHYLPAERLRWKYYLKLRKEFGIANAQLLIKSGKVNKRNKWIEYLSLIKFAALNLHYFLFPSMFKDSNCAQFVQEMGRRSHVIIPSQKINAHTL